MNFLNVDIPVKNVPELDRRLEESEEWIKKEMKR